MFCSYKNDLMQLPLDAIFNHISLDFDCIMLKYFLLSTQWSQDKAKYIQFTNYSSGKKLFISTP